MKNVRKKLGITLVISIMLLLFNAMVVNAAELPASGTFGTCAWEISTLKKLTIKPITGEPSGQLDPITTREGAPWYEYANDILSIKVEGKVYGNEQSRFLFADCVNAETIDIAALDTSNAQAMYGMFYNCQKLQSLDLSNFDTSKVTRMEYMFFGCENLVELDVSNFDTSKVTSMKGMFRNCKSIENLDLSSFHTGEVTSMGALFLRCNNLKELDISNFDTSKVTDMELMFSEMNNLEKIKIGNKLDLKTNELYTGGSFNRGTWKKEEDGKEYAATEISVKSSTEDVSGTYTKVSNITKELKANFPITYRIDSVIASIDSFETDRADIFEMIDDKDIIATIPLTTAEEYIVPGSFTVKFTDVVSDIDGNKYDLKIKMENIHLYDLQAITDVDSIISNMLVTDGAIRIEHGFYKNISDLRNDSQVLVNNNNTAKTIDTTISIVDKAGNPVEGSYIFSAYDLDYPSARDKDSTHASYKTGYGYGNYSEGINFSTGFDMSTLSLLEDTFLIKIGTNRITGTREDNTSELSELLIKGNAAESKFTWTAGITCGTKIISQYQPSLVEFMKEDESGEKVSNAKLALYFDGESSSIDEWTTGTETKKMFLAPNKYVLQEKQTPEGYNTAVNIEFWVDVDGKLKVSNDNVEKIVMIDNRKDAVVNVHHYIMEEDGTKTTTKVPSAAGGVLEDEVINKKYGETYTTTAGNAASDYELAETPANANGTVEQDVTEVIYYYQLKDAVVNVHHYIMEEDGTKTTTKVPNAAGGVLEDEVINKKYGETYTTTAGNAASDYELAETPTNANGTVEQDVTEVIYYYQLKDAVINVHHYIMEADGTKTTTKVPNAAGGTLEDEIITKKYGETYTTTAGNVLESYELAETPTNANGTVEQDVIEVIYYYQLKDAVINVHHYIMEEDGTKTTNKVPSATGEDLDKTIATKLGLPYTTEAGNVAENYELAETPTNANGTVEQAITEVVYYYKLKEVKYTVNYLDKSSNQKIKDSKVATTTIGKEIKASDEVITIADYTYDSADKANITIVKEENSNIINLYYVKKSPSSGGGGGGGSATPKTGKVITRYIDRDSNKEIASSVTTTGTVGEAYSTDSKKINGYVLDLIPSNSSGTYKTKDIEVVYYYVADKPSENSSNEPEFELLVDDDGHHEWYLRGYEDYTFRMNNNITREEVATIFYRLTVTTNNDMRQSFNVTTKPYSDVEIDRWSVRPIAYMKQLGIMQGYSDGTFKPSQPITRAEFAQVIMKYIKEPHKNTNMFSDLSESHWATNAILMASNEGWIKGYEDGSFRPEQNITRVEVVTIINRMLKRAISDAIVSDVKIPVVDLDPNHWGYADVLEAITRHDYEKVENGKENWSDYAYPFHEDMSQDAYNDV